MDQVRQDGHLHAANIRENGSLSGAGAGATDSTRSSRSTRDSEPRVPAAAAVDHDCAAAAGACSPSPEEAASPVAVVAAAVDGPIRLISKKDRTSSVEKKYAGAAAKSHKGKNPCPSPPRQGGLAAAAAAHMAAGTTTGANDCSAAMDPTAGIQVPPQPRLAPADQSPLGPPCENLELADVSAPGGSLTNNRTPGRSKRAKYQRLAADFKISSASKKSLSICFVCKLEGHWQRDCPVRHLRCELENLRLANFVALAGNSLEFGRCSAVKPTLSLEEMALHIEAGIDFAANQEGLGGAAYLKWCLAHVEVEFMAALASAVSASDQDRGRSRGAIASGPGRRAGNGRGERDALAVGGWRRYRVLERRSDEANCPEDYQTLIAVEHSDPAWIEDPWERHLAQVELQLNDGTLALTTIEACGTVHSFAQDDPKRYKFEDLLNPGEGFARLLLPSDSNGGRLRSLGYIGSFILAYGAADALLELYDSAPPVPQATGSEFPELAAARASTGQGARGQSRHPSPSSSKAAVGQADAVSGRGSAELIDLADLSSEDDREARHALLSQRHRALIEAIARPSYLETSTGLASTLLPSSADLRRELAAAGLNPSQAAAVAGLAGGLDLIQGPPGTGKSTTIAEIILRRVAPAARVVVTCQSNKAVDAVAAKLARVVPGGILVMANERRLLEKDCLASHDNTIKIRCENDPVKLFWVGIYDDAMAELRRKIRVPPHPAAAPAPAPAPAAFAGMQLVGKKARDAKEEDVFGLSTSKGKKGGGKAAGGPKAARVTVGGLGAREEAAASRGEAAAAAAAAGARAPLVPAAAAATAATCTAAAAPSPPVDEPIYPEACSNAAQELLEKIRAHYHEMSARGLYDRGLPDLISPKAWPDLLDRLMELMGAGVGDLSSASPPDAWRAWIDRLGDLARQMTDGYAQECRFYGTARVWLSTIDSLPALMREMDENLTVGADVDTVIVDEAGAVNEYSIPILLRLAPANVILIGDHFQLPPHSVIHVNDNAAGAGNLRPGPDRLIRECGHGRSAMERVASGWAARRKELPMLLMQYRMHPRISNLVSRLFYANRLLSPVDFEHKRAQFAPQVIRWVDVQGQEEAASGADRDGPSGYSNRAEVEEAVRQAVEARKIMPGCSVFLLSFYKRQVRAIRDAIALHQRWKPELRPVPSGDRRVSAGAVVAMTVNSVQGDEADVVILSTVRSQPPPEGSTLSFVCDRSRVNVGLSRARRLLVIVGSHAVMEHASGAPAAQPGPGGPGPGTAAAAASAAGGSRLVSYALIQHDCQRINGSAPVAKMVQFPAMDVRCVTCAIDLGTHENHPSKVLSKVLETLRVTPAPVPADSELLKIVLRKLTALKADAKQMEARMRNAVSKQRATTLRSMRSIGPGKRRAGPADTQLRDLLDSRPISEPRNMFKDAAGGIVVRLQDAVVDFIRVVQPVVAPAEELPLARELEAWLDKWFRSMEARASESIGLFSTACDPPGYGCPRLADIRILLEAEAADVEARLAAGTLFPSRMHELLMAAEQERKILCGAGAAAPPGPSGPATVTPAEDSDHGVAPPRARTTAGRDRPPAAAPGGVPVHGTPVLGLKPEAKAAHARTDPHLAAIASAMLSGSRMYGTPYGHAAEPPAIDLLSAGGLTSADATLRSGSADVDGSDFQLVDAGGNIRAMFGDFNDAPILSGVCATLTGKPDGLAALGSGPLADAMRRLNGRSARGRRAAEAGTLPTAQVIYELKCPLTRSEFTAQAVGQVLVYAAIVARCTADREAEIRGAAAATDASRSQRPPAAAAQALAALISHSRVQRDEIPLRPSIPIAVHATGFGNADYHAAQLPLPLLNPRLEDADAVCELQVAKPTGLMSQNERDRAYSEFLAAITTSESARPGAARELLLRAAQRLADEPRDAATALQLRPNALRKWIDRLDDAAILQALHALRGAEPRMAGPGVAGATAEEARCIREELDWIAAAQHEGAMKMTLFSASYAEKYWQQHVLPPLRRFMGISLDLAGKRPAKGGAWPGTRQLSAEDVARWWALRPDDGNGRIALYGRLELSARGLRTVCIAPEIGWTFSSNRLGAGSLSMQTAHLVADGNLETAWQDDDWQECSETQAVAGNAAWVTYAYQEADGKYPAVASDRESNADLVAYSLTSAADNYAADLRDWVVEARRRGEADWRMVDAQRNVSFSRRGQRRIFELQAPLWARPSRRPSARRDIDGVSDDSAVAIQPQGWDEIRLRVTATCGRFEVRANVGDPDLQLPVDAPSAVGADCAAGPVPAPDSEVLGVTAAVPGVPFGKPGGAAGAGAPLLLQLACWDFYCRCSGLYA